MPAGGNGNGTAGGNGNANGHGGGGDALPVRIIVQLEAGANDQAIARVLAAAGAQLEDLSPGSRGHGGAHAPPGQLRIALDPDRDIDQILKALSKLEGVRFAEVDHVVGLFGDEDPEPGPEPLPDDLVEAFDASNDPGFTGNQSWGMYGDVTVPANVYGSQAGEAWAGGYIGSTNVVVGLLDTGVDYTHADLYLNIWLNQDEIPDAIRAALVDTDADGRITFRDLNAAANASHVSDLNGNGRIDGGDLLADADWENGDDLDGNGLVDDLIGWDYRNGDNDPMDDHGHGTHVAGILAAQGGNGVGGAGVGWNTQIMALKFLSGAGGFVSDAVLALDYFAAAADADGAGRYVATNNSWGGPDPSQALQEAIDRQALDGILFVAAAGNGGADQIGDNNDVTPNYPSSYSTVAAAGYEAVISVASITNTGARSSFSNYGASSVDLGAPGSSIYSTLVGGGFGLMSGTSMATPFVAGAIALYAAADLAASASQIRGDLLATTIATPSMVSTTTGGRLDVSSFVYRADPGGVSITATEGNDLVTMTSSPAGVAKASVFNDTLSGLAGNDTLNGGLGADRLEGGLGNDRFVLAKGQAAGEVIVDFAAGDRIELSGYADGSTLTQVAGSTTEWRVTEAGSGATETFTLLNGYALAAADYTFGADPPPPGAIIGDGGNNSLAGDGAGNLIQGLGGNDTLSGIGGDDTLEGGEGADRLDGGAGVDVLRGGAGNDYYVITAGDVVTEDPDGGVDFVYSFAGYTLGPNLENMQLGGSGQFEGVGNDLGNSIVGNSAANLLTGLDGADSLVGLNGDDTMDGGAGADRLTGGGGADRFLLNSGEAAGDVLIDFTSGDSLELHGYGAGSTIARIGATNNWQITDGVTAATEVITLSNAYNLTAGEYVFVGGGGGPPPPSVGFTTSSVSQDEGQSGLTAFTFTVTRSGSTTGASSVSWAVAGSGANPAGAADFDGGSLPFGTLTFAADQVSGTITVNVAGDAVVEADEGFQVVLSAPSGATLGQSTAGGTITNDDVPPPGAIIGDGGNNSLAGDGAGNLIQGLGGNDTLSGIGGDDTLEGGEGADRLDGGAGTDVLRGGAGNDYYVITAGDVVTEDPDGGVDFVYSFGGYTLGPNLENMQLGGSGQFEGVGNDLGNSIVGNSAANLLTGLDGADSLVGLNGDDTMDGGAGADRLTGGGGADRFLLNSGEAAGDVLIDFTSGDSLELHGYGAGSTIARIGATNNWQITDGVTAATEVITLSNAYNLTAGEYVFT